jgi:hypothetical protein
MLYGVNYGLHVTKATFNPQAIITDLEELKQSNILGIRVAMAPFDNTTVPLTQRIAVEAKRRGFTVMWGVGVGTPNVTLTRWNDFLASFLIYADWAYQNNIDYLAIGNEEEIKVDGITLTVTRVRADILALAASIKARVPIKVIYATDQLNIPNWTETGALDKIGFNIYGPGPVGFQNALNQAKLNPKAIITEWSTADGIIDTTMSISGNEATWAAVLKARRDLLNQSGIPHYIFAVRGNSFGIDDRWSLWVGNTRRAAWLAL